MQIHVFNLKDGKPVEVQESYDPKVLGLELVDLKFLDQLVMKGVVEKNLSAVSFKGHLTSRVKRICGRTLKEVDEELDIPFSFYYSAAEGDEVIETLDDLRETVLIEQPMVYYSPGSENESDQTLGDSEDEYKKAKKEEDNPFHDLQKIKDRLKEE